MSTITRTGMIAFLLALAACGDTATERAATGGVAGAVVAGPVGAVAGGTVGAATAE
jgi:osmotically inducible lipoprotein OsmB